jgi:hypothetical protein
MANLFDPNAFFQKTAYYASQGRGVFKLNAVPGVLQAAGITANSPTWALCANGLMAKSVSTPGYSLATFEEFSYIGPTRKHAHTQIFGPLTIEFFLMGQTPQEAESIFNIFTLWQEKIAGARWGANEAAQGSRSDSTFFAIEYYDNYHTDATFEIYSPHISPGGIDKEINPIISVKYFEVWPQAIGGFNTSWESQDTPATLSVTFEYFHSISRPST